VGSFSREAPAGCHLVHGETGSGLGHELAREGGHCGALGGQEGQGSQTSLESRVGNNDATYQVHLEIVDRGSKGLLMTDLKMHYDLKMQDKGSKGLLMTSAGGTGGRDQVTRLGNRA
jgi:hypothetical protein